MPESAREEVRKLLDTRSKAACEEAVRCGGRVSPELVEEIGRLARLVELHDTAQPPRARERWPVVAALSATLAVMSILLFARVTETDVDLDLKVSAMSFVLPVQEKLTDTFALSALGVTGLREMHVPRARRGEGEIENLGSETADGALRVSAADDGGRPGTVSLEALILPAKTRVSVRHTGRRRVYRLALIGARPELRVSVGGAVEIRIAGAGRHRLDYEVPGQLLLRAGDGAVDLDLALPESTETVLAPQLPVTGLSFLDIDETQDAQHTAVRQVSTLVSGTLFLESLNGAERRLRPGEILDFEHTSGELSAVGFANDGLDLRFRGQVRGMRIGLGQNRHSLMPTWLEWLQARHGLSLLWGSALYAFGLIVAVLRWFGRAV